MKLSRPKTVTFVICLIVGLLTLIAHVISIPVIGSFLNRNEFFLMAGSWLLLTLAVLFKGL